MTKRYPQHYPENVSVYVPSMAYGSDVAEDGQCIMDLGAPSTLDVDGLLAAQSIAAAGSTKAFAAAYTSAVNMSNYGRNITVVASGAATSLVTVRGRDYLNQRMAENFTLNGATPVVGKKAFKYVDEIVWALTAGTTVNIGWGDRLGLPYRVISLERELYDGAATANAGTLVDGEALATPQTATTEDPRGLYVPHASNAPNGAHTYSIVTIADLNGLHGAAHFYA